MSSSPTLGVETRSGKRKRDIRDATANNAGEGIPDLPNHLVVMHVFRSEYFDDPADLARLRAVSHAMYDAVAATGRQLEELNADEAFSRGCLSALERLQRRGQLQDQGFLCHAAAKSGQLEKLKLLRENNTPWSEATCAGAAAGGHLEVLQWLRANGCPWNEHTCAAAAYSGQIEVLQWLRANGLPWDEFTCTHAAQGGHLEVLQWLRANGCPWNAQVRMYAEEEGHAAVIEWAEVSGAPEGDAPVDDE